MRHLNPVQYPIRRLVVRCRKVSMPQNLYLELYDRSAIRRACQISRRFDDSNYQYRGFARSYEMTSYGILKRGPGDDMKHAQRNLESIRNGIHLARYACSLCYSEKVAVIILRH